MKIKWPLYSKKYDHEYKRYIYSRIKWRLHTSYRILKIKTQTEKRALKQLERIVSKFHGFPRENTHTHTYRKGPSIYMRPAFYFLCVLKQKQIPVSLKLNANLFNLFRLSIFFFEYLCFFLLKAYSFFFIIWTVLKNFWSQTLWEIWLIVLFEGLI
jgi:hypothetical protein